MIIIECEIFVNTLLKRIKYKMQQNSTLKNDKYISDNVGMYA